MAFASISTIALTLGVLGAFVLVALGANNFAAAQISQFEIAVFVDSTYAKAVPNVAEDIRAMSGVSTVTVRDRDKEWAKMKRDLPNFETAGVRIDEFPYAMDVKVPDADRIPAIATKIRMIEHVHKVMEGRETLEHVMAIARVLKAISAAGVVILLVTSVFIISNAIKLTLYARRREIRIMQLVGATNQFIRMPLVLEGVFFGAVGAFAAWVLLCACTSYFSHAMRKLTFLGTFSSGLDASSLAVALIVVGAAIGAAGSFVSIRRFLHD